MADLGGGGGGGGGSFRGIPLKPPSLYSGQFPGVPWNPPFGWMMDLVLRVIDFILHGAKVRRDLLWLTLASFSIVNRSIDQHSHSFGLENMP